MLFVCCPVQRGTRVAATRHTRSKANSFINRARAFTASPPATFVSFSGEGVASAAAAVLAAFAAFVGPSADTDLNIAGGILDALVDDLGGGGGCLALALVGLDL